MNQNIKNSMQLKENSGIKIFTASGNYEFPGVEHDYSTGYNAWVVSWCYGITHCWDLLVDFFNPLPTVLQWVMGTAHSSVSTHTCETLTHTCTFKNSNLHLPLCRDEEHWELGQPWLVVWPRTSAVPRNAQDTEEKREKKRDKQAEILLNGIWLPS